MPQPLPANAPFIAVVAVVIAAFVVIGFKLGLDVPTLAVIGLAGITGGLAWVTVSLNRQLNHRALQGRAARFAAERMQAVLRAAPGGYCAFTPQGLLREVVRVPQILGIGKLAHFEDIVASLKDPAELVSSFRKLQQTGNSFSIQIETALGKPVQIMGQRTRVGREGPLADMLWFVEGRAPSVPEQRPSGSGISANCQSTTAS